MAANQRMEIHRKRNLTPARNVGIYTTDMKAFCMRKSANDYLTVTRYQENDPDFDFTPPVLYNKDWIKEPVLEKLRTKRLM